MKWINVEDRLPENTDDILIINECDIQIVACFTGGCFYFNGNELTVKVTHWMPTPELPDK